MSDQADLQVQLSGVLGEIARLEWKLALEEMVREWLSTNYPEDGSLDGPGRSAVAERKLAARDECERLNLELRELRSESVRITALLPVSLPRTTAIRLIRKPK